MSVRSYKGSPPSSRRGVGPGQGTKCEALYDFKGASAEVIHCVPSFFSLSLTSYLWLTEFPSNVNRHLL